MLRSLDEQRAALAARQQQYTEHLLAGTVPGDIAGDGLRVKGFQLASRILVNKRAHAAHRLSPALAELPRWRERFADYACTHPKAGCTHDDLATFTDWLRRSPELDRAARDWLAVEDVYAANRAIAWVSHCGRRELVFGIGHRVWRLRRRTGART